MTYIQIHTTTTWLRNNSITENVLWNFFSDDYTKSLIKWNFKLRYGLCAFISITNSIQRYPPTSKRHNKNNVDMINSCVFDNDIIENTCTKIKKNAFEKPFQQYLYHLTIKLLQ